MELKDTIEMMTSDDYGERYSKFALSFNYILAQGEKGLYIIDQHAAAERFHYEEIKRAIMAGVKDTQLMLMPLTLEKCEKFMPYLDEINAQVDALGIQFECFGDDTLIVRELPIWMKDVNEAEFLVNDTPNLPYRSTMPDNVEKFLEKKYTDS